MAQDDAFTPVAVPTRNASLYFFLGVEYPLLGWPTVSSSCSLSTETVAVLLFQYLPGRRLIVAEIASLHAFVLSLLVPIGSGSNGGGVAASKALEWKSHVPISVQEHLRDVVELVSWTEFREFVNDAILATFSPLWQVDQQVNQQAESSERGSSRYEPCAGVQPLPSKKRNTNGAVKAKASRHGGWKKSCTKLCIGSPSALAAKEIRHPPLPRTVKSKECMAHYMSRMWQDAERSEQAWDDQGKRILMMRANDLSLILPDKHTDFEQLVQRHGTDRRQQQQQAGQGRRRLGLFAATDEVRRQVLACTWYWHVSDANHPLNPHQLAKLARLIRACITTDENALRRQARRPDHVLRPIKELSKCLNTFLETHQLVATKHCLLADRRGTKLHQSI
ncbi:uncharacterized protein SPSC_03854 [Sporisorium scitamineum]|uniref:Uncharacterized protein n=1 Tax=Sporisorium scitamineum TaxID=49012 RepID=A0A0F7S633_9BASI|nr:uncharacterized protein SPSC_03854 [Sporisorium scitamineum]CDW95379.1 hypothetical protein [Sporisorium scitamineum]